MSSTHWKVLILFTGPSEKKKRKKEKKIEKGRNKGRVLTVLQQLHALSSEE